LSPRRATPHKNLHELSVDQRLTTSPNDCQRAWYQFFSQYAVDRQVLDVGAGTGYGTEIYKQAGARLSIGIDIQPLSGNVVRSTMSSWKTSSFDVVTAMDVIEHVEDDNRFLQEMLRIAREHVIFTTPNWNRSRCENIFHIREYTPSELKFLVDGLEADYFISDEHWNICMVDELKNDETACNFGVLITI
jgi:2-polyprenyl-3-methyl-5-hydroxy-6-metoxy-1,4-benzoquinol methylase